MKRVFSFILALILTLSLSVSCFAFSFPLPFNDVKKDQWFYPYVREAYEQGITQGTTWFTFEPNGTVTREMFVTMLIRSAGIDMRLYQSIMRNVDFPEDYGYSDIRNNQWYSPYLAFAIDAELTNGVGNGRFGLGEPVTREQMAALAARFTVARRHVQLKQAKTPAAGFSDANQISAWAREAAEAMRLAGVMQGDEAHHLNPQATATRAEAVAVILRLQEATERASFVPAGTASVQLKDQTNLVNGEAAEYEINDPKELSNFVALLDNMPIQQEIAVPPHGGWSYAMFLRDQQGEGIGYAEFGPDGIGIGITWLETTKGYFQPLIQMMK